MILDDDKETLERESYAFDDSNRIRSNIGTKVLKSLKNSFPLEWGGVRMEIGNLSYDNNKHYSLKEQKDALMSDKYLTTPIKGDVYLYDAKTNQLLDSIKGKTLMNVPYYTQRGTFIHNGNEYSTLKQLRLRPGVYTRRRSNGELETQFNVERGTGRGYRITLEPSTGIYKFNIGQSSTNLYSLLHDMGVSDDELRDAWGDDIFERNKKKYDARALEKVYGKMVRSRYGSDTSKKNRAQMGEELKQAFEDQKIHADIRKSNLGF
jgi:DNA-directed RNA polymerase beta subunit